MNLPTWERYHVIQETELKRKFVPYTFTIRTPAAVAAATTVTVSTPVSGRPFVWTHLGWTSVPVGLPFQGQDFRVAIRDINTSVNFQDQRFDLRAYTGTTPFVADQPRVELPVPWRFDTQTVIQVEFENIGTIPDICTLLLIGFLV